MDDLENFLFNRKIEKEIWYFDPTLTPVDIEGMELALRVVELFNDCERFVDKYDREQLSHGIKYIIDPGCSDLAFLFFNKGVSINLPISFIKSFESVFSILFARLCDKKVVSRSDSGISTINQLCYMWWDIVPIIGVFDGEEKEQVSDQVFQTISTQLTSGNIACVESSLHGLECWYFEAPGKVKKIINQSMELIPDILKPYAQKIINGNVC